MVPEVSMSTFSDAMVIGIPAGKTVHQDLVCHFAESTGLQEVLEIYVHCSLWFIPSFDIEGEERIS